MPTPAEQRMITSLKDLDASIDMGDPDAARLCCESIRAIDMTSSQSFGPDWMADMVKNKGLRLPALEDALKVDKVVLTGGVELKHGFLDSLTGKKPFKVDKVRLELKIEF